LILGDFINIVFNLPKINPTSMSLFTLRHLPILYRWGCGIYVLSLFTILFFQADSSKSRFEERPGRKKTANFIPFVKMYKGISGIFRHKKHWDYYFIRSCKQYGGNIAIFIPFGFFLPQFLSRRVASWRIWLSGTLFSIWAECIQWYFQIGKWDVDDIMLNSLGTYIGVMIFAKLSDKE
jgi:glycopeptide antibiotics resistance protein